MRCRVANERTIQFHTSLDELHTGWSTNGGYTSDRCVHYWSFSRARGRRTRCAARLATCSRRSTHTSCRCRSRRSGPRRRPRTSSEATRRDSRRKNPPSFRRRSRGGTPATPRRLKLRQWD